MRTLEYYISGHLMARIAVTDTQYEITFIEPKDSSLADVLPGFPLDEFMELVHNKELNFEYPEIKAGERRFKRSTTYSHENYEAILWVDVNCMHGALDLLVAEQRIVGALFTNGQATSYLVEREYALCSPLKEWKTYLNYDRGIGVPMHFMVESADGIHLGTTVWLPADLSEQEKVPALLIRTCYNSQNIGYYERLAASRGYAVVVQDVRGRDTSEGEFIAEYYEKRDALATLAWMKAQPWYGGKIGVIGASYLGYTAWATLASGDPDIVAAVSLVTAGSPFYGDVDRKNGAYSATCMFWDLSMSVKPEEIDPETVDFDLGLTHLPIGEVDEAVLHQKSLTWNTFMKHPDYDAFWHEIGIRQHGPAIDLPVLYVTGYHEGCINGTIEMWEMNEKNNREHQYLICGPWFHDFNGNRRVLQEQLIYEAVYYNIDLLYARWFDHWMKGGKMPSLSPVSAYIEGANKWIQKKSWLENTREVIWYLAKDNKLQTQANEQEFQASYEYDPLHATEQIYEEEEYMVPADYQEVEKGKDILCFTTAPLDKECTILGTPKVVLYASSSALDTDFVARMTYVLPNGESRAISSMILRAKYRNSFEKPELLEPGQVYRYEFYLPWVGRAIPKGNRIRLEICSAAKGDYFPNLNTGLDPREDTKAIVAHQTVYAGGQTQSKLILHVDKGEENI